MTQQVPFASMRLMDWRFSKGHFNIWMGLTGAPPLTMLTEKWAIKFDAS